MSAYSKGTSFAMRIVSRLELLRVLSLLVLAIDRVRSIACFAQKLHQYRLDCPDTQQGASKLTSTSAITSPARGPSAAAVLVLAVLALAAWSGPGRCGQIEFLHYWTGSLAGGVAEMTDSFNAKASGITVSAHGMEHESFKTGIRSRLAWGRAPDIFSYWAGERLRAVAEAGYLAPLDDLWAGGGLDRLFSRDVAAACRYNGKMYAVPVTQHMVGFFYNTAVFARFGLKPPRTWEELLDACARLKRGGVTPFALGARELWPAQFWFDHLLARTAGPLYHQGLMAGRHAYDDPQVRRAFSLWADLLRRGYFAPSFASWDWADAAQAVREGRAAMTLTGTWFMGFFAADESWRPGRDYGFFRFPTLDPGVPDAASGPIDVLAMTFAGQAKGAEQALAYFATREPQRAMCAGSGAFAPNLEAAAQDTGPLRKEIMAAMKGAAYWLTPFDLATPPPVAEVGLGCFGEFLRNPDSLDQLLANTQQRVAILFRR